MRILGLVVVGVSLWACAGKSARSDGSGDGGGSDASGGRGATGGTSGAEGGTGATGAGGGTAGSGGSGTGGVSGASGTGPTEPCRGLECDQTTCTAGQCTQVPCATGTSTTVSGAVYDPAGKIPLYNALVYVPNLPVPPLVPGASCARCDTNELGSVTETLTGPDGRFFLPDMPVGSDIPVVIRVGKWRRQITVRNVPRCVDTPLTDTEQTSLPSNKSEGDIPLIAITTGGSDSLECLLLRMGVEPSEFTTADGDGRIHLYAGTDSGTSVPTTMLDSGAVLPHADELWSDVDALSAYDLVILSCEGDANENQRPAGARQAVHDYTELGGRLLVSHWHHRWISDGPAPMPEVAEFSDRLDPETPAIAAVNALFPKGQALAEWLVNVGASTTYRELQILDARDNVQAVNPMYATEWTRTLNAMEGNTPSILNFAFDMPLTVPNDMKCGRVAYTGVHALVSLDATQDSPGDPFPSHCQLRDLTPQEKLLAFTLFDLSSCSFVGSLDLEAF